MWEAITVDNNAFVNYGMEHAVLFGLHALLGFVIIYLGRNKWTQEQQVKYITIFSVLVLLSQVGKVLMRLYLGNFDVSEDLPLQLCNIMPFFAPLAMYYKWRKVWGAMFFIIIGGTFQALITPTLKDSFPHYENIRYFLVHAGLTIIVLYGVFVYKWVPTIKDAIRSIICLHILALILYPVNLILNSNYLYLMGKPDGATLYDLLGPWPWYILTLEFVIMILFGIILIPFVLYERFSKKRKEIVDIGGSQN